MVKSMIEVEFVPYEPKRILSYIPIVLACRLNIKKYLIKKSEVEAEIKFLMYLKMKGVRTKAEDALYPFIRDIISKNMELRCRKDFPQHI